MRKITVGAIQQNYTSPQADCACLSSKYRCDADYLMERQVRKQFGSCLLLLQEAGDKGCDIVTTGEDCCAVSEYIIDTSEKNIFGSLVEKSSAMAEEKLSELARRYSMYVIGCYFKKSTGQIYNTASVFDRKGNIAGEYRKTHLPPNELWQVRSGEDINTICLDFGKIGISICYDMMFPEHSAALGLKGAEIIFHPTAGYGWYDSIGEATLRARANDGSFYIVTAKNYVYNAAGRSSVIDHWGQILADAGFYENVVVTKEIDLDIKKTQPDWHYQTCMSGIPDMRKRKLLERRPELYGLLSESLYNRPAAPEKDKQAEIIEKVRNGECHW